MGRRLGKFVVLPASWLAVGKSKVARVLNIVLLLSRLCALAMCVAVMSGKLPPELGCVSFFAVLAAVQLSANADRDPFYDFRV